MNPKMIEKQEDNVESSENKINMNFNKRKDSNPISIQQEENEKPVISKPFSIKKTNVQEPRVWKPDSYEESPHQNKGSSENKENTNINPKAFNFKQKNEVL